MEARNQDSSVRRSRTGVSRPTKLHRSVGSDPRKSSSFDSSSWSSTATSTPPTATQYQNRQPAIVSPSSTSVRLVNDVIQHKGKGKQSSKSDGSTPPPSNLSSLFQTSHSPLGPSMLSSSSYKSINLNAQFSDGYSDEPARLITYTKHSQGFTWNDELFLPSYLVSRHRYGGFHRGGNRRTSSFDDDMAGEEDDMGDFDEHGDKCPVTDIFVTDEEAAAMMP